MTDPALPVGLEALRRRLKAAVKAYPGDQAFDDDRAAVREAIAVLSAEPRQQDIYPIPLTTKHEQSIKEWAADDRLWTTQETVEFNLRTFARTILKREDHPSTENLTKESL